MVNDTGGGGNGLWHPQSIAAWFTGPNICGGAHITPHGRRPCGAAV